MPPLSDFLLERYYAAYEFQVRYMLSSSDCEAISMAELLASAENASRRMWDSLSLAYTDTLGHPVLREEVSRLYQLISDDDVLILSPSEGIFLAMHALLNPGDHVICLTPGYQSLWEVARSIGCDVTPWPVRATATDWTLDIEALEGLINSRTRLLVVNFPHNPTGFLPTPEELDAIVRVVERYGLYLFSDEMYRWLEHDPQTRLTAGCDLYEKAITLSGLSKSFGAPGLRIGWLATRAPGVRQRCHRLKDYTTICSSGPSEALAIMVLRGRDWILERSLAIVRAGLSSAVVFSAAHQSHIEWLQPRAGSVAFPRWIGSEPLQSVCARLRERGVLMVPGPMFEHEGTHFRVGLGRTDFLKALPILGQILEEPPG